MAMRAPIKIKYSPRRVGGLVTQNNYIGAQTVAGRRGTLPTFTNINAVFVSKAGSDSAPGTMAAPFLTIGKGLSALAGAIVYVVILDSGTYNEQLDWTVANSGLYAADGQAPTIKCARGAIFGTYGVSSALGDSGSGPSDATGYYVNQTTGNDGTGSRGHRNLPFKTIQAALAANAGYFTGGRVYIQDAATYTEDLDILGQNVTIRTTVGFIPTLVKATLSGVHLTNSGAAATATITGIKFSEPAGSTGKIFSPGANPTNFIITNCQLQGDNYAIYINDTTSYYSLINSNLFGQNVSSIYHTKSHTACAITNTYFGTMNCSGPVLNYPMAGYNLLLTISQSSFIGCSGPSASGTAYFDNSNSSGTSVGISGCIFSGSVSRSLSGDAIHIYKSDTGAGTSSTFTISNCYFSYFKQCAIEFVTYSVASSGNSTGAINATNCIAFKCSQSGQTYADFSHEANLDPFAGGVNNYCVFLATNCASFSSGRAGFEFAYTGGVTLLGTANMVCTNCVSINAASYGFEAISGSLPDGLTRMTVTGCAETASGTQGFHAANSADGGPYHVATCSYSCIGSLIGTNSGATITFGNEVLQQDPLFVNTAPGSESLALQPASPCWFTGSATSGTSMGFDPSNAGYTLQIDAANVTVDGIIFDGDPNFEVGIYCTTNATGSIADHCSFTGLGLGGAYPYVGGQVLNCSFATNGNGVLLYPYGITATHNVGNACGGALFLNFASNTDIENNTAYGCLYGQYDAVGVTGGISNNNIYSNSGAYDYAGDQQLTYTDAFTLDPSRSGSLDSHSLTTNPLLANPAAGDLTLKSIAGGYLYESPCIKAGSDGKDMGSYDVTYTEPQTDSIIIDFGIAGWRNPDKIKRSKVYVNLATGQTESGRTFGQFSAQRTRRQFVWENLNDMPKDQRDALEALVTCGQVAVQINFDGIDDNAHWKNYYVDLAEAFDWTELGDLGYADDSTPTPVGSVAFVEA